MNNYVLSLLFLCLVLLVSEGNTVVPWLSAGPVVKSLVLLVSEGSTIVQWLSAGLVVKCLSPCCDENFNILTLCTVDPA